MKQDFNRVDREQMIFQIMLNTRYTERALQKMPQNRLEELYRLKVEKRGK